MTHVPPPHRLAPDLIACYWTLAGAVTFGDHDESPWDLPARAEAAGRVGYRGIGIKHADLVRCIARHGFSEIRSILRDNGLRHLELEALGDWWTTGPARAASDRVRRDLIEAAAELGARHVKAYGAIPALNIVEIDTMRDAFDELAAQARAVGTKIVLEPIGCSAIPDLKTALAVLGDTRGKGGGLMFDIWHVTRGGIALSDIAALPPSTIGGVEINDGAAVAENSYIIETMYRRRLCGEGEFDLAGFAAAVGAAGYDGPWGVEIISETERALPLEQAASRSFLSAQQALAQIKAAPSG